MKRSYQVESKYTRGSKRAKRDNYSLTRALALRKPEIKEYIAERTIAQLDNGSISQTLITAIDQGAAFNERIGDKIKVLSIEVAGHVGAEAPNWGLMYCPKNNSQVSSSDIIGTAQGYLPANYGWTLNTFSGVGEQRIFHWKYSFPLGMDVHWNSDAVIQRNPVYLCFGNYSGTNVTKIAATFRVRYVDL
jgi:hypothetical protein